MEKRFQRGIVVQIMSGGPYMTIEEYPFKSEDGKEHSDMTKCAWFGGNTLHRGTFHVEMLKEPPEAEELQW